MRKRVFYSWQSDLPNNTNRGFINSALEKAIENISSDRTFDIVPFLDRDTSGLAGSPDITTSIFDKIDDSSVFVCDVSIINSGLENSRPTPNPNVLIELGYAIGKIGWHSIVLVMNAAFGPVEDLPFDLRGRRILTYNISRDVEEKANERKVVSASLQSNILLILDNLSKEEANKSQTSQSQKKNSDESKLVRDIKSKLSAIKSISYTTDKNEAAIQETKRYLEMERPDLAVSFALLITYSTDKNEFLVGIAEKSLEAGDIETAEKSIAGITYTTERNRLGTLLLEKLRQS
jgi:hypothetical protein